MSQTLSVQRPFWSSHYLKYDKSKKFDKAAFMSVYRKFAAKSIEKHMKKGPVTKPFGQDCSFCLMQYQENDCELFN